MSCIEQRGDEFGLQFIGPEITRLPADGIDFSPAEADGCRIRAVIGLRPRTDLDGIFGEAIAAQRRLAIGLGVAGVPEHSGYGFGVDLLANANRLWLGVDPRRIAEDLSAEAPRDNSFVLHVEIREGADHEHRDGQKDQKGGAQQRVARQKTAGSLQVALTFRDLELNSHNDGGVVSLSILTTGRGYELSRAQSLFGEASLTPVVRQFGLPAPQCCNYSKSPPHDLPLPPVRNRKGTRPSQNLVFPLYPSVWSVLEIWFIDFEVNKFPCSWWTHENRDPADSRGDSHARCT